MRYFWDSLGGFMFFNEVCLFNLGEIRVYILFIIFGWFLNSWIFIKRWLLRIFLLWFVNFWNNINKIRGRFKKFMVV